MLHEPETADPPIEVGVIADPLVDRTSGNLSPESIPVADPAPVTALDNIDTRARPVDDVYVPNTPYPDLRLDDGDDSLFILEANE